MPRIKGKIISSLGILNHDPKFDNYGSAILSFYVLKNEEYSKELYEKFVSFVLPKIYSAYKLHKDGNPGEISGSYYLRVELLEGEFIIHEGIE